ncbi:MAG: AIR synthase-related protein, partial [Dehalococcoidia bacterium]|nr:AIR synthase-related protein [Dehalococcoidia bacterium]
GGEIAQLPEIIKGERAGRGFDLAASAVGIVPLNKLILGQDIRPGDALVGLASSGVHSNGLTLARRVFFGGKGLDPSSHLHGLGRSIGEELLEPTRIYVAPIMEVVNSGLQVKALFHVTGEGFLNLTRHRSEVDWVIDYLPEAPPIFHLIQRYGQLSDREMCSTFNMGIGFCVCIPASETGRVLEIASRHEVPAWRIGHAEAQRGAKKRVALEPKGLELTS